MWINDVILVVKYYPFLNCTGRKQLTEYIWRATLSVGHFGRHTMAFKPKNTEFSEESKACKEDPIWISVKLWMISWMPSVSSPRSITILHLRFGFVHCTAPVHCSTGTAHLISHVQQLDETKINVVEERIICSDGYFLYFYFFHEINKLNGELRRFYLRNEMWKQNVEIMEKSKKIKTMKLIIKREVGVQWTAFK